MSTLTHIEYNGERMLVNPSTLDGYPGAVVLETGVSQPPNEFCTRQDGKWVEDTPAKEEAESRARLLNMTIEQRQREFIDTAKAELLEDLIQVGAVDSATVASLRRGGGSGPA